MTFDKNPFAENPLKLISIFQDVCGAFRVQPREAKMRGNHTSVFEVRFDPTEDETFYSRDLMARVFKLPCCPRNFQDPNVILMNFIPDFVSVRLIGIRSK